MDRNTETACTEAQARAYADYGAEVLAHSNSICYISDIETHELLYLTPAGMALCGFARPEDYAGKKCYEGVMGRTSPCPYCPKAHLIPGEEYRWEYYHKNIQRWFDRTSSIIEIGGRRCQLEIGRDITARKEELSLLSGQLSLEDVLFRCLHTLTSEQDMETAMNLFLEAVGGYYQADRAYIFEQDPQEALIHNTFEWCAPGVASYMEDFQTVPLERVAVWYEKFRAEGAFSIASVADALDHDSPLYQELLACGVTNLRLAPLLRAGEIVGMLGVNNPKKQEGSLLLLKSVGEFAEAELERRRLMRELEYLSYTDVLTGLKNRNQYNRALQEYERRTPESLGVIFIDINGMKGINDGHGYNYGDHIIKKTARCIADTVSGQVFRIGGDEFAVLSEDLPRIDWQQEAVALREGLAHGVECSVSLGCAWRAEPENVQTLIAQAGELLSADKQSYYLHTLEEGRSPATSPGFYGEVLKEIQAGRFVVYYQPQVDIQTGKIIGAEALVRKRAEDGVLVPPGKFIPFYEMEGVVSYIDLFVLKSACAKLREWMDQGHDLHLSVNFSRVTLLEPGIVNVMETIADRHDVPTSAITIEVTESVSKMDNEQLKELIGEINAAGFTISLDDFGSQYSNLAILADMDFDEIKFDRSLIETLEHNPKSRVVMENSVRMCRGLKGTTSLAEGIETKGQLELLLTYHCDYGQGYYFSKPVPPEEFESLLSTRLGIEEVEGE